MTADKVAKYSSFRMLSNSSGACISLYKKSSKFYAILRNHFIDILTALTNTKPQFSLKRQGTHVLKKIRWIHLYARNKPSLGV